MAKAKPEMVMTTRINLAALKAVSAFASTDEARYYLNGVFLEIEPRAVTYVATDGHRLLAHREGTIGDEPDNDMTGAFIIPTAQCKEHKFKKSEPAYADLSGNKERLMLDYQGLGISFAPIDGDFVEWRRVVPQMPISNKLGQYNGVYLASFSKFAHSMGWGELFYLGHNGEAPALIRFFGKPDTIGMLMPVRSTDESAQPLPDWAVPAPFMQAAAE